MSPEYNKIDFLIKSRLLFNSIKEYRQLLDIDVDSFIKRYEDKPSENLEMFMHRFNNECMSQCGYSASYIYIAYRKASDEFANPSFWRKWKHKTSKKALCRWIFKKAYLKFSDIYEKNDFEYDKDATEILETFKTDLNDPKENIDIVLTMLFAYDILKPYSSSTERFSYYKNISGNIKNLITLLEDLRTDLPTVGLHKDDNVIINTHLKNLRNNTEPSKTMTAARLWQILDDVAQSLRPQESPAEMAESRIIYDGYAMNGIWIDDSDKGENRFWIFPDNQLMAFCFRHIKGQWHLRPYEFAFYRPEYEDEFDQSCTIVTAKGNEQILMSGFADDSEVARLDYNISYDDTNDDGIDEINFSPTACGFPYWMDWRGFKRLSKQSELYKEFNNVIGRLYSESEMTSESFYNYARWLTDSFNCLIGMDNHFIYVSDLSKTVSFKLERIDDLDTWIYIPRDESIFNSLNLLNLQISDENPLYIIPRSEDSLEAIGKEINSLPALLEKFESSKNNGQTFEDFKRDEKLRFIRFRECACSTEFGDQITLYNIDRNPLGKVLCFNRFSKVFSIARLKEYGVKIITSKKEFLEIICE